jgi:hypothetical protein
VLTDDEARRVAVNVARLPARRRRAQFARAGARHQGSRRRHIHDF